MGNFFKSAAPIWTTAWESGRATFEMGSVMREPILWVFGWGVFLVPVGGAFLVGEPVGTFRILWFERENSFIFDIVVTYVVTYTVLIRNFSSYFPYSTSFLFYLLLSILEWWGRYQRGGGEAGGLHRRGIIYKKGEYAKQ